MKKTFIVSVLVFMSFCLMARDKDSTIHYTLPDSVKAVQFMTEVTINSYNPKKKFGLGIRAGKASLRMWSRKKTRVFVFYTADTRNIQEGLNTNSKAPKDVSIYFYYKWQPNETYKLLISQATDSAAGITIYSGYVFLPREGKWKFIGSGKVESWHSSLLTPSLVYTQFKKQEMNFTNGQTWVQRSSGSWKNLKGETLPNPVINLFGHLDSVQQRQKDVKIIEAAIASGKTDVKQNEQGVYYRILKEGSGRQVAATDTVSVLYHLNILNDTATIDEAKNTPARFPLNRLIRGWSIGVPLIKVGGKIRLVIPSDLAYSIRTRSAKIPPNSILVFDIEVVDAKPPN